MKGCIFSFSAQLFFLQDEFFIFGQRVPFCFSIKIVLGFDHDLTHSPFCSTKRLLLVPPSKELISSPYPNHD